MTTLLSTPARNTRNSATKFAAITQPLNELCNNMDSEMRKCFVGPMPVRDFLETFLPVQPPPARWGWSPEFGAMAGHKLESQMYNEFTKVANSICNRIKAFNTSNNPSGEEDSKYKPDITFYDANTSDSGNRLTSFQRMEMFVEFKRGNTSDPFYNDDQLPFEKLFETTCATRGQIVLYSTRLQTYQFRTWAFSVGIFGNVARLFRWDRAGAIVSEPIPYCKRGNHDLAEFLRRFDLMDRVQRGWDPTVFDATREEAAAFDGTIEAVVGEGRNVLLKKLLDSVGDKDNYPRRRVEISTPDGEDERVVSYIVGRSIANARSPTGRATRGFVAMSKGTGKLVFLKDSWRPDIPGMMGEAHWFEKVKGARSVSAFLHGSDVRCVVVRRSGAARTPGPPTNPFQHTLTNLYSGDFCGVRKMVGYIHYRTVQCEFYVPLDMFKDSKHLIQIMYDIIVAIQDLYDRGIIHRDISTANIMITINGSGRLIDLDLARDRDDVGARVSVRTGTWQFMSTQLLIKPGKVHELCDDLESFWFVLLFEGLHFVKHNEPGDIDMAIIFDQASVSPATGTHTGGLGKLHLYLKNSRLMNRELKFESKPFTTLVRQIYRLFQSLNAHYLTQDLAEDNEGKSNDLYEKDAKKLESCGEIKRLLGEALNSGDWPEICDKVEDQYPPTRHLTPKQKDTIALSYANQPLISSLEPLKRKREQGDDPQVPEIKRLKTGPPLWKRIWSKCTFLVKG